MSDVWRPGDVVLARGELFIASAEPLDSPFARTPLDWWELVPGGRHPHPEPPGGAVLLVTWRNGVPLPVTNIDGELYSIRSV